MVEIPPYVRQVLEQLEAAGHEAWCVGGCVRDSLLGRVPGDWDVATAALPEETMALSGALPTGLKHGTVTIRTEGGPVEATTFRMDGAYRDHRRPDTVSFTRSLEEDLRRRDFTVNAMAVNLAGELRDPFGGRADLQAGLLRCVGDPDQRFQEDALRILRCLRFLAELGFAVHPDTAAALRRKRGLLREIAVERIWAEFRKLLQGPFAAETLRAFPEAAGVFWPELLDMVGLDQRNRHHCYDVWEHSLHALAAVPAEDDLLRCAALLHDVGKPSCFTVDQAGAGHFYGHPKESARLAESMLRRLKCPTEFRERAVRLVLWHDRDIPRTDKGLRRALLALGEPDLRRLLALKRADNLAQAPEFWDRQKEIDLGEAILNRLLEEGACFSLKQLEIRGSDLLDLGLSGPAVGRTLNALLEAVVDGELENRRDTLLARARELAAGQGC